MKISIKNLLFQPLALHLATDGEGLHLSARECKEILAEHVSEEIERAAARGLVSLVSKAARVESSEQASDSPEPATEPQAGSKKGKAR